MYLKPKKSLGQHFLKNFSAVRKIAKALELKPGETVVEIGPGTGVLTEELLKTNARVVAVEKDDQLAALLKKRFENHRNLEVINEDILDFSPHNSQFLIHNSGFKVCGNLPYNISGRILETALEVWPKPEKIVFMLQKEVAEKLCAKPPKMAVLPAINQFLAEFKILFSVSRKNFFPQPKVNSAVLEIIPKKQNVFQVYPELKRFIKSGFAYPRKYLISSLSDKLGIGKDSLKKAFQALKFSEKIRPGELKPEQWLELYLEHSGQNRV